jgi:uncharacterized protein Ymh
MREAFHPKTGALTDKREDEGERQALADLSTSAVGSFKNPPSHRDFPIDAQAASEVIHLANYLLRVVDTRADSVKP